MIKKYFEQIDFLPGLENLNGTILDIETDSLLPKPKKNHPFYEKETYKDQHPTIIGMINSKGITQYYCETPEDLPELMKTFRFLLNNNRIPEPYFAYFNYFERYVLNINIDGELGMVWIGIEKKERIVKKLGISDYDDPYHGDGAKCIKAFWNGEIEPIKAHNRACVLKELKLYELRGYRHIDNNYVGRYGRGYIENKFVKLPSEKKQVTKAQFKPLSEFKLPEALQFSQPIKPETKEFNSPIEIEIKPFNKPLEIPQLQIYNRAELVDNHVEKGIWKFVCDMGCRHTVKCTKDKANEIRNNHKSICRGKVFILELPITSQFDEER